MPASNSIFTRAFALAIVERAVKTFCQALAAMLVANGTGLLDTDWIGVLSVVGMTTLASVLTNIGTGLATDGTPAVCNTEILPPESVKDAAAPEPETSPEHAYPEELPGYTDPDKDGAAGRIDADEEHK